MLSLNQKRLLRKAYFEIRETGFYVSLKDAKLSYEEEYKYEDFANRVNRIERKQPLLVALAVLSSLISISALFSGSLELAAAGISVLLIVSLIVKVRSGELVQLYLRTGHVIQIDAGIPDEQTVNRFIWAFEAEKRKQLIGKYGHVDRDLPIELQLNQLVWLRNEDYIDEKTLNELKNKLLGKEPDARIGFHRREE